MNQNNHLAEAKLRLPLPALMALLGYGDHAATHLAAALPHVSGDYMGEHWLASFALLALLSGTP